MSVGLGAAGTHMDSTVLDSTRQARTKAFPSGEMTILSPVTGSRNSPSPAGTLLETILSTLTLSGAATALCAQRGWTGTS